MFRFKQFSIQQEQNAMKVCTDSCLFGAVIETENAHRILDIGTGTGLLALMLAQRSEAIIEAIEIAPEAASEASDNFRNAPWNHRMTIHTGRVQDFEADEKFDLIISNPPFFKNSLRSGNERRNQVMQQDDLRFDELAAAIARLLMPNGKCWLLLPPREMKDFSAFAKTRNLVPEKKIRVCNRKGEEPIRMISVFSFEEKILLEDEVVIYEEQNYTEAFTSLLKPYYLKL